MLAALLVAFSVSAPATLTSAALPKAPIIEATTTAEMMPLADSRAPVVREPDFGQKYFPFSLRPDASQQVKDSFVMSIVLSYLGCCICAPAWVPVVLTKDATFEGEVLGTAFGSTLFWIGGSILTVGLGIFVWPYGNAVATLNAVDRELEKRGVDGGPAKKPDGPSTPATPTPGEPPPPSYAY